MNLNNSTIEVFENPDPAPHQYRSKTTVDRSGRIQLRVGDTEMFEFDAADVLP